ncbi:odorant receptor 131-2-like [Boleophthalmus pectinirostris]|uniref:odorant receptor 131-2-like n=1 Tax=Boleophthalmus pectinirostris TaxID=150288 RepID=UPI00242D3F50|nr:odorant receptor 131-2-like [Boleophthalmus pectinirostris]
MEGSSNSSSLPPYDEFPTRFLLTMATSLPSFMFLFINGSILSVLRSKPTFSQCPRYVLLFNLVLSDTILIAQAQTLYLLATYSVWMSYPLCISLTLVSYLSFQISPYTLMFMSLERFVAVCLPLKHPTIITLKNTYATILLMWSVSCLDVFIRVMLILEFPFHELPDLQMREFCSMDNMSFGPKSSMYNTVYTYFLFATSALVILSSFMAVMVIACLASEDKAQVEKTRNTLLLHLFQLGLNFLSVMHTYVFVAVVMCCGLRSRLFVMVYVCVVLMPRCLSALTYGLRDPALRPALGTHLSCGLQLRAGRIQVKGLVLRNKHM